MASNKAARAKNLRRQQERRHQREGAQHGASLPSAPAPSLSPRSAAADHAADGFRALRDKVNLLAKAQGHWAGVPMPLQGEELVIEPRYPFAKALGRKTHDDEPQDFRVRNQFWSRRWRCDVFICEEADGRITKAAMGAGHGNKAAKQLRTLGCSDAWGLEQEERALATLRSLVTARQYRHYVLTGSFLESSRRSGVTYLFRRLRPTLALGRDRKRDDTTILACLCMHPIAHYADSWAGAMCPTDDVIAHLALMRGDEAMYWKRSTQHPADRPEAGL